MTSYLCHVFFTISNVYIQAVLIVILSFVSRPHVSKLDKHGNPNKSPPINIDFLIAGLENMYFFGKNGTTVSSCLCVCMGVRAHARWAWNESMSVIKAALKINWM